ncbi:MAG: Na/Pi cotransporter family protein [Desulfitobacteriia bacterium]|jgi:phosphate:Na+ symporter
MITFSMVTHFLGGLGLFLYGINMASEGLQKIAANRIKDILQTLTRKTWMATLMGVVMTVAFQSSAATTVMIVEFVNSGLMTLSQALGVVLGSAIGTSVVIQLISFNILDFALLVLFIGFILFLIIRTRFTKLIGQTLIGFGCVFVGRAYLSNAFAPLKDFPEVYDFLAQFGANPILGVLSSALLTGLIQSSAAYLAILITLSGQGLLSVQAIVPLVLGAQIGSTFTALISSLGAERIEAKRVTIVNTVYRIIMVVVVLTLLPFFERLVLWSAEDLGRQVANAHLFSSLFLVILFLPLNKMVAKFLVRIIPQREFVKEELSFKYITHEALSLPAVALNQARREMIWLGHLILENMLQLLPRTLLTGDPKWIAEIESAEKRVNWYHSQLQNFFKQLFSRSLTREQIVENHSYRLLTKELEFIADCLVNMARLVSKIHSQKVYISENEWLSLERLFQTISRNYLQVLCCIDRQDPNLALKIQETHSDIIEAYNMLRSEILGKNQECSDKKSEKLKESQEMLIELSNWLYKIGEHITIIVKIVD